MYRGQIITQQMEVQHVIRGKKMLNELKHFKILKLLCFFSDAKQFDQDQKLIQKGNRRLSSNPQEVPHVMHAKFYN